MKDSDEADIWSVSTSFEITERGFRLHVLPLQLEASQTTSKSVPYQVTDISTLPGIEEVVGVSVQIGVAKTEDPIIKRFPQCRIRPVRRRHREINWNDHIKRNEELRLLGPNNLVMV